MSCEVRKFCIIILYLHYAGGGNNSIFEPKVVIFTAHIKTQIYIYKICELHRAIFSSFYNI
jgi:hypothetical protein